MYKPLHSIAACLCDVVKMPAWEGLLWNNELLRGLMGIMKTKSAQTTQNNAVRIFLRTFI